MAQKEKKQEKKSNNNHQFKQQERKQIIITTETAKIKLKVHAKKSVFEGSKHIKRKDYTQLKREQRKEIRQ